jgi:hypothetical protein
MINFTYTYKSKTVFYNGYVFDSLVELKFALMIEETHAWLRDGIEIYYGVNVQTSGIKQKLHCYRPDFLIRNLATGVAELIEIKPDGFTMDMQRRRARKAAQHMKRFAYDWSFRIITESQIFLSTEKWRRYKQILDTQNDWRHKPCIKLLQNNTRLSDQDYEQFVRTGVLPALVP